MTTENCDTIQEMMSQRLYETLEQPEEIRVSEHLSRCTECTGEWEKMQAWVDTMPNETPHTQFDLWPSVRSSITEQKTFTFPWKRLVVSGVMGFGVGMVGLGLLSRISTQDTTVQVAEEIPTIFEKAEEYRTQLHYQKARELLGGFLEVHPDSPDSGKAQMILARISFEDLENFKLAHGEYELLQKRYPQEFARNAQHVYRLNLLDEAQSQDSGYTVLERLNRARESSSIIDLERVVADFPGTFMADEAVMAMVESVSDGLNEDEIQTAMNSLVAQCTHPVAQTYVQLGVANHYQNQASHTDMVIGLYETVAQSEVPELALQAREQLAKHIPSE